MSSEARKAVFDNLTLAAGRRAELEYSKNSASHRKVDSIEASVWSMRLSTQMHVMDWAEAQCEDPEIVATMDWRCLDKKIPAMDRAAGKAQVQAGGQEKYSRGKKCTAEC